MSNMQPSQLLRRALMMAQSSSSRSWSLRRKAHGFHHLQHVKVLTALPCQACLISCVVDAIRSSGAPLMQSDE